jgi:hypothetical protein
MSNSQNSEEGEANVCGQCANSRMRSGGGGGEAEADAEATEEEGSPMPLEAPVTSAHSAPYFKRRFCFGISDTSTFGTQYQGRNTPPLFDST